MGQALGCSRRAAATVAANGYAATDVVVMVGPSGVGKSTLIQRLMGDYPGKFGFSVSHTTRPPRPGEEDGVHYNFTTVDAIKADIARGAFVEHAEVHGKYYGTSFEAVRQVVSQKQICLLDIDVQGAQQMKESSLNSSTAYVFVAPPSMDVLESRLRSRGTEKEEDVAIRLANATKEVSFAEENPTFFDEVIVNDDLEMAYDKYHKFLENRCGADRLQQ